jgi:hypothetical protein
MESGAGKSWNFELQHENIGFQIPAEINTEYNRFADSACGGQEGHTLYTGAMNSEQVVTREVCPILDSSIKGILKWKFKVTCEREPLEHLQTSFGKQKCARNLQSSIQKFTSKLIFLKCDVRKELGIGRVAH